MSEPAHVLVVDDDPRIRTNPKGMADAGRPHRLDLWPMQEPPTLAIA